MDKNTPEFILIHHSLTKDGLLEDFSAIKDYHIKVRKFVDIGYHWLIERVGNKWVAIKGRDEDKIGAHCKENKMNYRSIGICVVGNFDKEEPPQEALEELTKLIVNIRKRHGKLIIDPHTKYAPYKSCPGKLFPIDKLRKMVVEAETRNHWAYKHWENLNNKGIKIHDMRFDDKITRGEVFALIDRLTNKGV